MIETALAYIFTVDADRRFVGCGVLVEGGFVATCRHVWAMATESEEGARASVAVEFPNAEFAGIAPAFTATLAHACEERMPDLVLLAPTPEPRGSKGPLQVPVARHKDYTCGDAYTIPYLRSRECSAEVGGTISSYRPRPKEMQGFSSSETGRYWAEEGSSGAPVFLKPKSVMHLAGILALAELPARNADPQSGQLREAFVVPGDIIWTHVAAAMAAKVAEHVPAESLRKLLEELGQQNVAAADIPTRLGEAIAAMKASAAAQVTEPLNLGGDIDETIETARKKLDALDPQAALAIIRSKREEAAEARKDATQREVALLREQARIQRLAFDHLGALATLAEIVALDPTDDVALVEAGDIHENLGDLGKARAMFEGALCASEANGAERQVFNALYRIGSVRLQEGDRVGALEYLLRGHPIIESLVRRDPGNAAWQRDLSVSHERIGDVREAEGDRAGALDAYAKALAIREDLARRDPGNAAWQRDLSVSHNKIGDVRVAEGDRAGALDAYAKALAIAEDLARRDPGNAAWQRDLSVSHSKIGDVRVAEGDWAGALDAYAKALAIREDLARRDPGNAAWQRDLSVSHERIGDVRLAEGDRAGALDAYAKDLAIAEDLARRDPGNAEWQRDLSVSHIKIGDVRVAEGDRAGALDAYAKALVIAEYLARRDPGNAAWQRDLSVSHERIGDVREAEGDRAGALDAYAKALAIREDLARRDPGNATWQRDLSVSHEKIGDVRVAEGDRAGALDAYAKALAIREDLARRDPGNAEWQRDLAGSLWRIADLGENATEIWPRVVAIYEALDRAGRVAPPDRRWLDEARRRRDAAE